jgi:hypothetical protein
MSTLSTPFSKVGFKGDGDRLLALHRGKTGRLSLDLRTRSAELWQYIMTRVAHPYDAKGEEPHGDRQVQEGELHNAR